MRRLQPAEIPSATYRLQFNRDFTFSHAAELAEYLATLGVSHCYASPIWRAAEGSSHGYDVADPTQINPELGGMNGFKHLMASLQKCGLGLILDVVPNHMCVTTSSNPYWWDLLESGPASQYARLFDIDWTPPKEELSNKILLPRLADQYGRVLEDQQIQIFYSQGAFFLGFYQNQLPLAPSSWIDILSAVRGKLTDPVWERGEHTLELESILTALSHLPQRTETNEERILERMREKEIIKRRLMTLVEHEEAVRIALTSVMEEINGIRGEPRSFDRLERLLADQAYRLSYWRVAADEINYRRFFDINDLAAIRVEEPEVFQLVHSLLFELIRQGHVSGLRVDHPDGLFDPEQYFLELQKGCLAARIAAESDGRSPLELNAKEVETPQRGDRPFFVVAEKIMTGNENLRPQWAIEGTTGYGFLNFVNGLFVDASHKKALRRLYRRFTGWSEEYRDLVYNCKRLILQVSMSSELNVLARQLDRISEQHRWSRDFTLENLRDTLKEVVTCFPVYRTYIRPPYKDVDAEDQRHIVSAVEAAKRRNRAISESVFDFIQSVLLLQDPSGLSQQQLAARRLFVMRFQQFTGPVMAKGLEDTAFFRYYPLVSLNEVGGNPEQFGISVPLFHTKNRIRQGSWPNALLATSTHDTKRSEDVRARLNVLSEIPIEWARALFQWQGLNHSRKRLVSGEAVPSANEEYLLYQTLIGTWPLNAMRADEHSEYLTRIHLYMEKALREAKVHSSWVSPNSAYESAVRDFVTDVLTPSSSNDFLNEFIKFQAPIARAGMFNSLSQLLIKLASPGIPDIYQGTEIWDFSLVDPDNRRPVDFGLRRSLLAKIQKLQSEPTRCIQELLTDLTSGMIKLFTACRILQYRRAHNELFAQGDYLPLFPQGDRKRHIVAFARRHVGQQLIAVAGRFFASLASGEQLPVGPDVWGNTQLILTKRLKEGVWRDELTGQEIKTETGGGRPFLPMERVFSLLPVALLTSPCRSKL
jgi:(1->4)-alpha-D-glucan 1-alpha-D-glucosylmutase